MRSVVPVSAHDVRGLVCPYCHRTPSAAVRGFRAVRAGRTLGAIALRPADAERDLCPVGASVIERLWVVPDEVREQIGTQLVQRACALLLTERARCLVAYSTLARPDCEHLPPAWLAAAGFSEHVGGVQWRIDLRRTVPGDVLRALVGAASGVVRPLLPRPQAATRTPAGMSRRASERD